MARQARLDSSFSLYATCIPSNLNITAAPSTMATRLDANRIAALPAMAHQRCYEHCAYHHGGRPLEQTEGGQCCRKQHHHDEIDAAIGPYRNALYKLVAFVTLQRWKIILDKLFKAWFIRRVVHIKFH
jgi:hypothetical protein